VWKRATTKDLGIVLTLQSSTFAELSEDERTEVMKRAAVLSLRDGQGLTRSRCGVCGAVLFLEVDP
jgi:hypothetical protein